MGVPHEVVKARNPALVRAFVGVKRANNEAKQAAVRAAHGADET
jgi:hypothetical protein